jgi:uncharacterized protein
MQIPAPPRGYGPTEADVVVDAAGALSAASVARINGIAFDVRQKSGGEIAVAVLSDIGDRAPDEIALEIGRQWGVGAQGRPTDAARNRGVVILVVPKETASTGRGSCFIATGDNVEGFITDADAGDLCRQAVPYFQRRDYDSGVLVLASGVGRAFAQEFGFTLDSGYTPPPVARTEPAPRSSGGIPPQLFLILLIFVFFFLSSLGRGRRGCGGGGCLPIFLPFPTGGGYSRGGWGGGGWGGGGGGGFGGFGGGGGFSGGGGGSSW